MKLLSLLFACVLPGLLSAQTPTPPPVSVIYEAFSYEPGVLPGSGEWKGEDKPGVPRIEPGSLKFSGLASPQQNRVFFPNTASKVHDVVRTFPTLPAPLHFSLLIRMDSVEGLAADRPFGVLRFNKDGANPAAVGIYVVKSADGTGFQVVASKRANPVKRSAPSAVLPCGSPHLLVGHYDNSVVPHVLKVWVNPAAEHFGAATAPEPALTTADGTDLAAPVNTLVLSGGVGCPGIYVDEIRLGAAWADVVPSASMP